jgi:hypothetical protein
VCGKTFTFLPPFSLPYSHYSLIAVARRFGATLWKVVAGKLWRPLSKIPSGWQSPPLRRWFRVLDFSQPRFSFLRPTTHAVAQALEAGKLLHLGSLRLCRQTIFACLHRSWPLRL